MRKLILFVAGTGIALFAVASPASAHVRVSPNMAEFGGDATLSFDVPNEEDSAVVNKVELDIPTDHPIASINVMPKAGWSYQVESTDLKAPVHADDGSSISSVVSKITWSGGQIKPSEFDTFVIDVSGLPTDVNQVVFKAVQTYSDGKVVAWNEAPIAGAAESLHPAPVLTLGQAGSDGMAGMDMSGAGSGSSNRGAPAGQPTQSQAAVTPVLGVSKAEVDSARSFGIMGLAVGAFAVVIALVALNTRRTLS